MSGRLDGKVALVTGAARGIGAAIARRFAEEGAELLLTDADEPGVRAVAAEIGDGDRLRPARHDEGDGAPLLQLRALPRALVHHPARVRAVVVAELLDHLEVVAVQRLDRVVHRHTGG